jgi:hypothetical protein
MNFDFYGNYGNNIDATISCARKAQYRKNSLKFDNWQKASRQCAINRIHLKKGSIPPPLISHAGY